MKLRPQQEKSFLNHGVSTPFALNLDEEERSAISERDKLIQNEIKKLQLNAVKADKDLHSKFTVDKTKVMSWVAQETEDIIRATMTTNREISALEVEEVRLGCLYGEKREEKVSLISRKSKIFRELKSLEEAITIHRLRTCEQHSSYQWNDVNLDNHQESKLTTLKEMLNTVENSFQDNIQAYNKEISISDAERNRTFEELDMKVCLHMWS